MLKKIKSFFPSQKVTIDCSIKPDDWLFVELGQSPVHCLWFCHMFNMETEKSVAVEEYDTAQQALEACVAEITKGN